MSGLAENYTGPAAGVMRGIVKAMNAIIIIGGCIMALTFFSVVILRYGFDADLFAYEEWLLAIAFWMFFMASAVASYRDTHITADILGIILVQPKAVWRRTLIVKCIELIILAYLTYLGLLMVLEDLADYPRWQTTIALKIPFIVPRLGIFLGLLMMTVFTVLALVTHLKSAGAAEAADSPDTNH